MQTLHFIGVDEPSQVEQLANLAKELINSNQNLMSLYYQIAKQTSNVLSNLITTEKQNILTKQQRFSHTLYQNAKSTFGDNCPEPQSVYIKLAFEVFPTVLGIIQLNKLNEQEVKRQLMIIQKSVQNFDDAVVAFCCFFYSVMSVCSFDLNNFVIQSFESEKENLQKQMQPAQSEFYKKLLILQLRGLCEFGIEKVSQSVKDSAIVLYNLVQKDDDTQCIRIRQLLGIVDQKQTQEQNAAMQQQGFQ
ncbi:Hypothetical_protein [Hexamita inflata]|uniref:Hypothetical_protein n=2 Tax=Hexamita inflata TaxID=28002 RepID=A0AA86TL65_9EUKA|nr:Hypothetical protein HINF_LOCUS6647 [Hexamita inflata]